MGLATPVPARRRAPVPAAIQYVGAAGTTELSVQAVVQLVQYGRTITKARILTGERTPAAPDGDGRPRTLASHALLLTVGEHELVAVKSGFHSGYGGTGPSGFSYVLQLLEAHGAGITEHDVGQEMVYRLDQCLLTDRDLEAIEGTPVIQPYRWHDYIFERDYEARKDGSLWHNLPLVVPYAIIDGRLMDLALNFWQDPNAHLRSAFARLEDTVRARTGFAELIGAELFKQAFLPPTMRLEWRGIGEKERAARALLFQSVYAVHRNPRAHRELEESSASQLSEFLLVNHLYCLEREARGTGIPTPPPR